ncbi:hypothetical protein [Tritonibacter mobilis]|uniref:hypothetical protein n=1 Tax=Tritonibacter mobilis TaxID=379347 RepID=UPI00398FC7C4
MSHTANIETETNMDNPEDPSTELEEINAALATAMIEIRPVHFKAHCARMMAKEIGQFTSALDDVREPKHPAHLINAVAALEE